jgi:hypothetical protein
MADAPARQQFRGKWTLTGANSVVCFWQILLQKSVEGFREQ